MMALGALFSDDGFHGLREKLPLAIESGLDEIEQ
jgi:hypothetical protein